MIMRLLKWLRPRLRLWAIYRELGYIPWRKPSKAGRQHKGVYMGTKEAIPFMNEDAKRTLSHLFLRPGYMMRDYINGQHERYLSPITALLVFYSVFTLLAAVVQPGEAKKTFGNGILDAMNGEGIVADLEINDLAIKLDSTDTDSKAARFTKTLISTVSKSLVLTHLDLYPEAVDTPWKESLAAIEGELRSKGIPLFLGNFLLLWLAMVWLLKKKYGMSVSGSAAASAFVLCQYSIFMFLALLVTFGRSSDLGVVLMGVLLFIDYRQLLKVGNREALGLTVKTGLVYLLVYILFYLVLSIVLIAYTLLHT